MGKSVVRSSFTKFVYPFVFEKDYIVYQQEKIFNPEIWEPLDKKDNLGSIFPHLNRYLYGFERNFSDKNKSNWDNIDCFSIKMSKEKTDQIFHARSRLLTFDSKEEGFRFHFLVNNIECFLFRTSIGLVSIELKLLKISSLEDPSIERSLELPQTLSKNVYDKLSECLTQDQFGNIIKRMREKGNGSFEFTSKARLDKGYCEGVLDHLSRYNLLKNALVLEDLLNFNYRLRYTEYGQLKCFDREKLDKIILEKNIEHKLNSIKKNVSNNGKVSERQKNIIELIQSLIELISDGGFKYEDAASFIRESIAYAVTYNDEGLLDLQKYKLVIDRLELLLILSDYSGIENLLDVKFDTIDLLTSKESLIRKKDVSLDELLLQLKFKELIKSPKCKQSYQDKIKIEELLQSIGLGQDCVALQKLKIGLEISNKIKDKKNNNGNLPFIIDAVINSLGVKELKEYSFKDRYFTGFTFCKFGVPLTVKNCHEDLFRLRRFYKNSYIPAGEYIDINKTEEVLQTFKDVYFGFSLEGGASIQYGYEDKFLNKQFEGHVRNRYFPNFILALHQRYALRNLADRTAQIPLFVDDDELTEGAKERIKQKRRLIFNYILRHKFSDISDVSMHNEYYLHWRKILRLKPLLDELKQKVEEVDDFYERDEAKQEAKNEKSLRDKTEHTNTILTILAFAIQPSAILVGWYGMNMKEFSIMSISDRWVVIPWLIIVLSWVVLIFIYLIKKIMYKYKKKKRIRIPNKSKSMFGYKNGLDEIIIEPQYRAAGDFKFGRSLVKKGHALQYIDRDGKSIMDGSPDNKYLVRDELKNKFIKEAYPVRWGSIDIKLNDNKEYRVSRNGKIIKKL